jgi:hypothetical protein
MMRTAFALTFAGLAAAAQPQDTNSLAPADAKSEELKQLLALDSFNVTSSDAEQNRMHAVCDMEYRLSKTRALGNAQGLGISNLMIQPADSTPLLPFNPFSMPLLAVKAHISLLEQEKTYLQAQSDAFEGKASASSTSAATTSAFKLDSVDFFAVGVFAASSAKTTTRVATDTISLSFSNMPAVPKSGSVKFTVTCKDKTTAVAVGGAMTITFAGNKAEGKTAAANPTPCWSKGATDSAGDDIACPTLPASTNGFSSYTTGAATEQATMTATSSADGSTFTDITQSSGAFTINVAHKAFTVTHTMPSTHSVPAVKSGMWAIGGAIANMQIAKKMTVTMEVFDAASTLVGSSVATSTLGSD